MVIKAGAASGEIQGLTLNTRQQILPEVMETLGCEAGTKYIIYT